MDTTKQPSAREATRLGHARRIERVVDHLGDRLDQPLTLDALAAIGHFSPYHFHRIYRGAMGETVADTLRRMRLHRAAVDLLHGTRALSAIARRCGYGSAAAFNRAFASAHGVPPGEFRRRGVAVPIVPAGLAAPDRCEAEVHALRIVDRDAVVVAAWRHHGDYHAIGATFDKLGAWAAARGLDGGRSFGIYPQDPDSVADAQLVSDACIEVPDDIAFDGDTVVRRTLAAGPHAVIEHVGSYAGLEPCYRWLYGEWLPASGREAADTPVIEEYLNDARTAPPSHWRTAICLPLVPETLP